MLGGRGRSSHNSVTKQGHLSKLSPESFPMRNRKLRLENWEEECVSIKEYRSRSQLARKKSEPIPLLKLTLHQAQITRNHQKEYNIYLPKHPPSQDLTHNIQIINGQSSKLREIVQYRTSSSGFYSGPNWQTARFRQSQQLFQQRPTPNENYPLNVLQVMGQEKKLSPERIARPLFSSFDYKQLKL